MQDKTINNTIVFEGKVKLSIKREKCDSCSKYKLPNDLTKDKSGKKYCKDCIFFYVAQCEVCKIYHRDITKVRDENRYIRVVCKNCLGDNFYKCSCCSFWHDSNKGKHTLEDGTIVCNECFKNRYFVCKKCNKISFGNPNNNFCHNCLEESGIHSSIYMPELKFHRMKNEKTKLFIGVELEIDGNSPINCAKYFKDNIPFVYCKEDCSLSPNGIEIVSHPATYRFHIETNIWKNIFETLSQNSMEDTTNCGLHFHISRNFFTEESIRVLDYLVNTNSDYFKEIGGREFNDYCEKRIKRMDSWGETYDSDHCDSVNLSNEDTIEIRFCKSTSDYDTFMERLKLIKNLVLFSKTISFEKIVSNENIANNMIMFEEFIKKLDE